MRQYIDKLYKFFIYKIIKYLIKRIKKTTITAKLMFYPLLRAQSRVFLLDNAPCKIALPNFKNKLEQLETRTRAASFCDSRNRF